MYDRIYMCAVMNVLIFTFPEKCAVWWKFTAIAEVVGISGDEVCCCAAACIKMSGIWSTVSIDSDQNTFTVSFPLKDTLSVCQYHGTEITIIQCVAGFFAAASLEIHTVRSFRPCVKAGTQSRIPLTLICFCTPFTAVVHTRNARHTEAQCVDQRQMLFVGQVACNPADIMVIYEAEQMFAR